MLHISVYVTIFRHKCADLKNKCNALNICWNLQDTLNFKIIISLEYQVFYFVYLFVIRTITMFVKIFYTNCVPFGLLDI
jgi:hypothetical protein